MKHSSARDGFAALNHERSQIHQRIGHPCRARISGQQLINADRELFLEARNALGQQAKHQPQRKFICQHSHRTELRHHALLITTLMEQI